MKKLILLMVATVLSLPSAVLAQTTEQADKTNGREVPSETRLANPELYRNVWKYKQYFPLDVDYYNHIRWTEQAFAKPIVGKVKDSMDAHRLTVVLYDGAQYNAGDGTLDRMNELQLPIGTKVELCQDITLMNPDIKDLTPRPTQGVYMGTMFTMLLPDSVFSWDVMSGHFGSFTDYGYCHIDQLMFALASPPPYVNDTQFNGYQPYLNGNVAGMSFGNINQGTYLWAFVPRVYSKNAIFDSGFDPRHNDFDSAMVDFTSCYNVPLGNTDVLDSNGHGTRVAGLMSGQANNLYGIAGVNCQDTLVVYKVWAGSSISGPNSYVISAINYAHTKGIDNKNFSLGGTTYDPSMASVIAGGYTTFNSWTVSGAGNSGTFTNSHYPACYPKGHAIVGRTVSGGAWSGSSTTDSAWQGACSQNVMSPNMNSTYQCSGAGINGTSFGTPIATGSTARIRNFFPDKTDAQVEAIIKQMLNGGGVHTTNNGWGTMVDSLVYKTLRSYTLVDDTLTAATCSGKYRIGALQYRYKWVDSGWVGTNLALASMTAGDTINTNLIAPGTYICKRWVKSIPDVPGWTTAWYDTLDVVVIISGPAGTTPSTVAATGSTTVCNTTSFNITTSGNTGSATKTWYRNGVSVGTGNTFTQTSGLTPGTYTYFCVADLATTTTCWTKAKDTSNTITVTITTTPTAPGSITGNTSICSGSSNTYSISAVTGATSYTWTLPTGWTGTSTTNSISTTAGSAGGTVSVTANNSCGSSSASTLSVTVNSAPATPGTISGSASICSGSSNSYSITAVAGATSYTWTLPTGWTGTSTTNSISTTAGSTGGTISVTANNSCGSSSAATLAVTVNTVPSTPGSITGSTSMCAGSSNSYSITAVTGATSYTWSLPTGWTGTSTTNTISATAGSTGGTISVVANNGCGSSSASTLAVSVTTPVTPSVTIVANPAGPICAGTSVTFAATPTNGGTTPTYQWKVNGINVGTGGPTYTSSSLVNGDNVTVVMTTSVSCVTAATATSTAITMIVNPLVAPPLITVTAGTPYPSMGNWLNDYTFGSFSGPYDVYRKVGGVWTFQATIPGNVWTHTMDASADTISGVYHLSGCYTVDSSISNTVYVSSPVSVAALPGPDELQLYPNPTTSLVYIKGLPDDCIVTVFAVDGRLVYQSQASKQSQEMKVDLSSFTPGVYQVRIHADKGAGEARTYKVIKQ